MQLRRRQRLASIPGTRVRRLLSSPSGFTILELMIVVAVLAIIVAVALPNYQRARVAANEASAIQSLRMINTMNERYRVRFRAYAGSLANLQAEGYIASDLAASQKSGYTFAYTGGAHTYSCASSPIVPNQTGYSYFFTDETGVIRFSTTGTANATSMPLGQ